MKEVNIIVAVAKNGVIGKGNDLPWKIPKDLKYFRSMTNGHVAIMGRKSFESIGKVLPNRVNIVLSRNEDYEFPEGVIRVSNLGEAIDKAEKFEDKKIWITGGAGIYKLALEEGVVDKIYITRIEKDFEGDTYFPEPNWKEWKMKSEQIEQSGDGITLRFQIWSKK